MAVASVPVPRAYTPLGRFQEQTRSWGLFVCLTAFTLTTLDGGDIAPRFIGAVFLVLSAWLLVSERPAKLLRFPLLCLLCLPAYGVIQTLWFPQHIAYLGWSASLFWFTAAMLAIGGALVAQDPRRAAQFRLGFVWFGSAICLLELLQQASRTNRYFWIVPSKFSAVYGSFAYWNNFAEFVEILLPITLWSGVMHRRPDLRFLLLAAVQIGAVSASGSRAGAALVIIELVVVLLLAFLRNRNRAFLYAAASTIVLTGLFISAAGVSEVMHKLHQKDQLNVRRDLNASSLDMIREHPLTGWGLDTYVPVYRMFARFDNGSYVNRAHNDWLQWTAEGGLLFSGLMLAVFIWSIRPALRSIWAIGLLAVCVHALVDYPFARFGVCGWYFALLGMLAGGPRRRRPATVSS